MRCVCALTISLKCAHPSFFLHWPHSTSPPEFLPLQLLACCKSDQGAELVLTSASLFWGFFWFVFFFPPKVVCFTVLLQEKIVLAQLR